MGHREGLGSCLLLLAESAPYATVSLRFGIGVRETLSYVSPAPGTLTQSIWQPREKIIIPLTNPNPAESVYSSSAPCFGEIWRD